MRLTDTQKKFMKVLHDTAHCPHMPICGKEGMDCRNMFPGFIGRRYAGLVIVGHTPSNNKNFAAENEDFIHYVDEFRKTVFSKDENSSCTARFLDYNEALCRYMNSWPEGCLVSREERDFLDYDIENVAFINIVKCFRKENKDTRYKEDIQNRCFRSYCQKQLEILSPRYIICIDKRTMTLLKELYTLPENCILTSRNGRRDFHDLSRKLEEVVPRFKEWNSSLKTKTDTVVIRRHPRNAD